MKWERFYQAVARVLPKKLLYFAYIRLAADVTSGPGYDRNNPTEMKMMDALKLFEDKNRIGHKYEKCWCRKIK